MCLPDTLTYRKWKYPPRDTGSRCNTHPKAAAGHSFICMPCFQCVSLSCLHSASDFFSLAALDCMQCLELMRQSNFSAVAITDGTTSNKLIGNFSVSDLRSACSIPISVHIWIVAQSLTQQSQLHLCSPVQHLVSNLALSSL